MDGVWQGCEEGWHAKMAIKISAELLSLNQQSHDRMVPLMIKYKVLPGAVNAFRAKINRPYKKRGHIPPSA